MHHRISIVVACLCLMLASHTFAAPPATQPDAASLLQRIDAAYSKLASAQFDGRISSRADVAGQQRNDELTFTSTFRAPNRFRHESKGDLIVGSTGDTAYVYQPSHNVYTSSDAPKERAATSDWPHVVVEMLQQQNPSLLLAITKSASDELKDLAGDVTRLPDTTLDGDPTAYPTIQFELPTHQRVTMLIDPATSLLRQVRYDWEKTLEQRGAADVKSADVTIDYTTVKTDVVGADDHQHFAWTPPAGATLASAAATGADDAAGAASAMIGKPAPDFTLPGLDDKPTKLSSTKGSVVVLDFWATWCGPCVGALPKLDEFYKDQSPRGLKMFAIDQQEEKEPVKAFVEQKKLSIPVLLDSQGTAGKPYGTDEGIPITVIIGKDGVVKKVFVGTNDAIEEQIKATVAREMGS
jgi:peroxiredoxin/outer membrane lipoprotein-sorting protein